MLPGEYRKAEEGRYNKNMNLSRLAANRVVGEVTVHYRKAHIITMAENKMKGKIEKLHQEYASLGKLNPERKCDNPKMKLFLDKLHKTMPFWPRDVEKRMEDSKEGNKEVEKIVIDEDLEFLKSMMMDRDASYLSQDKIPSILVGY